MRRFGQPGTIAPPCPIDRAMSKPAHQNPALPEFWEHRFINQVTPWDAGGVPADFRRFVEQTMPQRPRTLIPGCGSAWEARALAEQGWPVTALDFSPAAISAARNILAQHADCLLLADFFQFDAADGFELIYERAFLCALPRSMWSDWAARLPGLLRPGGLLAGYFFFSDEPKGPPFGISPAALDALLSPAFERIEDRPVADSIPVFAGRERWQVWQRKA